MKQKETSVRPMPWILKRGLPLTIITSLLRLRDRILYCITCQAPENHTENQMMTHTVAHWHRQSVHRLVVHTEVHMVAQQTMSLTVAPMVVPMVAPMVAHMVAQTLAHMYKETLTVARTTVKIAMCAGGGGVINRLILHSLSFRFFSAIL